MVCHRPIIDEVKGIRFARKDKRMGGGCEERAGFGYDEPACVKRISDLELFKAEQTQVNRQTREAIADNKKVLEVIGTISNVQAVMQENINFIKEGVSDIKSAVDKKASKEDVDEIKSSLAKKASQDDLDKLERENMHKVDSKDLNAVADDVTEVKTDVKGIKDAPAIDIRQIKVGGAIVIIGAIVEIIVAFVNAR
jgi:hypothetical protein